MQFSVQVALLIWLDEQNVTFTDTLRRFLPRFIQISSVLVFRTVLRASCTDFTDAQRAFDSPLRIVRYLKDLLEGAVTGPSLPAPPGPLKKQKNWKKLIIYQIILCQNSILIDTYFFFIFVYFLAVSIKKLFFGNHGKSSSIWIIIQNRISWFLQSLLCRWNLFFLYCGRLCWFSDVKRKRKKRRNLLHNISYQ